MILRSSPASPFGRKCKISASILGLTDRIEVTRTDTIDPNAPIQKENPLGKIPALILDDGTCVFDSRVICECLDNMAGGGKIFPQGDARWPALTLQALCDGILDAGILQVYEKRFRPEDKRHPDWVERQKGKVERALAHLESNTPATGSSPHIGDITLACALGYLDFRFEGTWRENHPNLVAWLDKFADAVPTFGETTPSD
ncbi:MAG: glutathione S-transferase family protein [Hyphomicrobiaceae bacterium]|nr:glutathione S-transferase family protein [Hyphomicrobiaceae bacterium]